MPTRIGEAAPMLVLATLLALPLPAPQDQVTLSMPQAESVPEGKSPRKGSQPEPGNPRRAWRLPSLGGAETRPLAKLALRRELSEASEDLHLLSGGKPRVIFHHPHQPEDGLTKPFAVFLAPASGEQGKPLRLTKDAGGKFTHHRGLFYGFNKTSWGEGRKQKADFWHCRKQASIRGATHEVVCGEVFAQTEGRFDWIQAGGKKIVHERRIIRSFFPSERLAIHDVAVTLSHELAHPVFLQGDPQHAGMQYRAAQEVHDRSKETVYLRPEDASSKGNDVWHDCSWAALRHPLKDGGSDRRFVVLYMRHPQNHGKPVMSTRNYGRFGFFFTTRLDRDKPLTQRYRLVIAEESGEEPWTAARCQRLYAAWIKS